MNLLQKLFGLFVKIFIFVKKYGNKNEIRKTL